MQNRFVGLFIALSLVLAPALADTTSSSDLTVAPSNSQYINPTTNANASTSNVSTQINNNNLGANSYGPGITCQSAQIALGGFGERQSSGVGLPNADSGVTVQYLTPVGPQSSHTCQALANEVVHQKTLDTQLTMIQKCADFARAGIVLDPHIYPELSRACAGIHVTTAPAGAAPIPAYPRSSSVDSNQIIGRTSMLPAKHHVHLSDFSPSHNSELQRIAMHRLTHLAYLHRRIHATHLSTNERVADTQSVAYENDHLRAVIAEYQLENQFLHRIAADHSWHSNEANRDLKSRILSYVTTTQGS